MKTQPKLPQKLFTVIENRGVIYRWCDYHDNVQKIIHIDCIEFLRRFSQHILPKGFVRIRHFGILSSTHKQGLQQLQIHLGKQAQESPPKDWKEICRQHLRYDPDLCPFCGKGVMVTIERFLPGRGHQYSTSKQFFKTLN